ncbi:MAG: hypothetical protein A3I11_02355 [Elusimicrobia bacterium RIFCSPLOWO2_02_FULL_39_32]|nr:MAG: hypothetical protein A2034_03705 [Elusimicrobia bacterium GWA2_38_7]OGR78460.1 MAG: hypothetical protein A3B80_07240 [Elusimicrobia bacterium RIFCSPHIGHO2_02_FULL_39_36]OGR92219.1 MAG: hypothetical protein A3I11_02355 [Elusimicrobia bacterium RIFCSPLOWO2_02_FULL_39_32]OGR99914.1 MAG: hypothetical protein A3G85_03085 [Elusimicrobia bacterium RIFCSPLOWO2_12_FULL_39_28]
MKNWFGPSSSLSYLGVGLELAGTILICFFIGYWLDKKFNCLPWLTLVGGFLGLFIGLYQLISQFKNEGKNDSN